MINFSVLDFLATTNSFFSRLNFNQTFSPSDCAVWMRSWSFPWAAPARMEPRLKSGGWVGWEQGQSGLVTTHPRNLVTCAPKKCASAQFPDLTKTLDKVRLSVFTHCLFFYSAQIPSMISVLNFAACFGYFCVSESRHPS